MKKYIKEITLKVKYDERFYELKRVIKTDDVIYTKDERDEGKSTKNMFKRKILNLLGVHEVVEVNQ